jgi:hypothetical protein
MEAFPPLGYRWRMGSTPVVLLPVRLCGGNVAEEIEALETIDLKVLEELLIVLAIALVRLYFLFRKTS